MFLRQSEGGIESFDVADLQNRIMLFRDCGQLRCISDVGGEWFFNESRNATLKKLFGGFQVKHSRCCDDYSVKSAVNIIGGRHPGCPVLFSDAAALLFIRVNNCNQIDAVKARQFSSVVLSE